MKLLTQLYYQERIQLILLIIYLDHQWILASIEKNIHITDTNNGFVADIADLDLDFLDKIGREEKKFNIEVTIDVNVDTVFYNNEEQNNGLTWVVSNNDCYGKPEDSGYLSYAA